MQTCRLCSNSFPLNVDHYGPDPGNSSGFRTGCRACLADEARKRYAANPEPVRLKARERRQRRSEVFRASGVWRAT